MGAAGLLDNERGFVERPNRTIGVSSYLHCFSSRYVASTDRLRLVAARVLGEVARRRGGARTSADAVTAPTFHITLRAVVDLQDMPGGPWHTL